MQYAKRTQEFTQKVVTTGINVATRTTGALTRMLTNPMDPSSYTNMLGTMAQGIGDVAELYGEGTTAFAGENNATNLINDAFGSVSAAADGASEALAHYSMELELSNDPISALLRQFDPVRMARNSVVNTEIAAQVHGKGRGYMMEAQLINAVKQPLAIAGSMLVTAGVGAGSTGIGSVPGAIVAAIGAAVITLANSTHVDVKTGERSVKMTDQAAIQSAIAILTAVIGGMGMESMTTGASVMSDLSAQLAVSSGMSLTKQIGLNAATSYAGGMVKYDAKGQSRGLHAIDSDEGKLAAVGAIAAAGLAAWGGSDTKAGLMKGMKTPGMSPFAQGFSDHILGAVEGALVENVGYAALGRYDLLDAKRQTDLSAGLGLLGGAAMSGAKMHLAAKGKDSLWERAREAQREGKNHEAVGILRAMGYRRDEELMNAFGRVEAQNDLEKALAQKLGHKEATDLLSNIKRSNKVGFGEWDQDWATIEKTISDGGEVTMGDVLKIAQEAGLKVDFGSDEFKQASKWLQNEEKMQQIKKVLEQNPGLEYNDRTGQFYRPAQPVARPAAAGKATGTPMPYPNTNQTSQRSWGERILTALLGPGLSAEPAPSAAAQAPQDTNAFWDEIYQMDQRANDMAHAGTTGFNFSHKDGGKFLVVDNQVINVNRQQDEHFMGHFFETIPAPQKSALGIFLPNFGNQFAGGWSAATHGAVGGLWNVRGHGYSGYSGVSYIGHGSYNGFTSGLADDLAKPMLRDMGSSIDPRALVRPNTVATSGVSHMSRRGVGMVARNLGNSAFLGGFVSAGWSMGSDGYDYYTGEKTEFTSRDAGGYAIDFTTGTASSAIGVGAGLATAYAMAQIGGTVGAFAGPVGVVVGAGVGLGVGFAYDYYYGDQVKSLLLY